MQILKRLGLMAAKKKLEDAFAEQEAAVSITVKSGEDGEYLDALVDPQLLEIAALLIETCPPPPQMKPDFMQYAEAVAEGAVVLYAKLVEATAIYDLASAPKDEVEDGEPGDNEEEYSRLP